MKAGMQQAAARYYTVAMPRPDDFAFWRDQARQFVQSAIEPERIMWNETGGPGDLFSAADSGQSDCPLPSFSSQPVRSSKRFLSLARNAALHSDPQRFAVLYRLLWRLQTNIRLMEDKTDNDVRRLEDLDKSVRRDSHKMHAFVRFREIAGDGQGVPDRYVAWFEPDHHIVRANAEFFRRRFTNMHWSILTPKGGIHWDGMTLRETPPTDKSHLPAEDGTEDLWRQYFVSTFNPSRLKVNAMMSEMPKKYWKNMPETALIPGMIASAQSREAQMVDAGSANSGEPPHSLAALAEAVTACRRCPIGCLDNQAVVGAGPAYGALMIVGEQPGDQEDVLGQPFVGPAGQVLDDHLRQAGIDRQKAYVTNAVKHFKFTRRGKRRIHQTPTAKEIDTCRWWLESERALVRPDVILALGASAARGILGRTVNVTAVRGRPHMLEDGTELWITIHPSYLLRLDGEARTAQDAAFQDDLRQVAARLNMGR